MTVPELINIFEQNEKIFIDNILSIAVYAYEPDEADCRVLENGLRILAENNNKTASIYYALVTVYDNNCHAFSSKTAHDLLLKNNAFTDYHDVIIDTFKGCIEEEELQHYLTLPTVWYCEKLAKAE